MVGWKAQPANLMFTVTKEFHFEAAHSLPHLPVGHKCRNLHGHSYRVRVEVDGQPDERGFVVDYAEIAAAVDPIIARLDHKNLNELLFGRASTAENLAEWIYNVTKPLLPAITRIAVSETRKTWVIYAP